MAGIDKMLEMNWDELLGIAGFVLGLIIAPATMSKGIAYIIAAGLGFAFGRQWYNVKKGPKLRWYLIIAGFGLGFTLGAMVYAPVKSILTAFIAGLIFGWASAKSRFHW